MLQRQIIPFIIALMLGCLATDLHAQNEQDTDSDTEEEAAKTKKKDVKAISLVQLQRKVAQDWAVESKKMKQREQEYVERNQKQKRSLAQAEANLEKARRNSDALERAFENNKVALVKKEKMLKDRLGTMQEMFGVVRQMVADLKSGMRTSMVSAQYPGRQEQLAPITETKDLPTIDMLQTLWYLIQQETTESGKIATFKAPVLSAGKDKKETVREVIRLGNFNAISDGRYLFWNPTTQKLQELERQPSKKLGMIAQNTWNNRKNPTEIAIDPARGAILSLIVKKPSVQEKLDEGGMIGYFILLLGSVCAFFILIRFIYIAFVGWKVRRQLSNQTVSLKNPLGRIISVSEKYPDADIDVLELKLDEAMQKETARLNRLLWLVKIITIVAPLLGLLGTITGMIRTFQAITLYGTGDPKMMAAGISEALVTTMLGLVVAIPLVLAHSGLRSLAERVITVLEEKAASIIADRLS